MVVIIKTGNSYGLVESFKNSIDKMELSVCMSNLCKESPIYVESVFNQCGELEFNQILGYANLISPMERIII
jgi:hypothetical protein